MKTAWLLAGALLASALALVLSAELLRPSATVVQQPLPVLVAVPAQHPWPAADAEPRARVAPPVQVGARPFAGGVPPAPLLALLQAQPAQLRASIQAALQAPQRGGQLYAQALARRCADHPSDPPPADPEPGQAPPDVNDPRHQRALARAAQLFGGCSQLTPAEWQALANVGALQSLQQDPLLALLVRAQAGSDAVWPDLLRQPDPLLLENLGPQVLTDTVQGTPAYYFDGRHYATDLERKTVEAAWALLPCAFGLPCDEGDPGVAADCLHGLGCRASRSERVFATAEGDTAPPPAEVLALLAQLTQAVRTADCARFVPAPQQARVCVPSGQQQG